MADHSFWSRLKNARLVQVLVVYLGASWAILQGVELFQDGMGLPDWIMPVALILLAIGLFIVLITAWVQSHPLMEAREAADDVPGDWELALSEVKDSLLRGEVPHPNWARAMMGGVFMFSLLFGAAGLYVVIQDRGESFQPPPIYAGETAPSIAVLPFRVTSDEMEEWEEGMVDLLSTGLDGAAGLRAVDSRTILSRWDRTVDPAVRPDLATALGVAASTGARFALEGSVTSIGDAARLVARVHDLESGGRLGTAQVQGSLDAPHGLVDRLSMEVLQILLGGDSEDLPRVDLAGVTTTSTEALRAYLRGERRYREGRFEEAVSAYQEAVGIDSTFALAHHRLDLAMGWSGVSTAIQERHRERARELAARLPDRERLLVNGYLRMTRSEEDSTVLETPLEEAVERYPNDAEAHYLLAETYYHESDLIMAPAEIEEIFERAVDLDPEMPGYRIHHVDFAFGYHADSAMAARRVAGYRSVTNPDDPYLGQFENALDVFFGDAETRAAARDRIAAAATDPDEEHVGISGPPSGPLLLEAAEELHRFALENPSAVPGAPPEPVILVELAKTLANQGRFSEARGLLANPELSRLSARACLLMELRLLGVPGIEEAARTETNVPFEAGMERGAECRAILAADLGMREEFETWRQVLSRNGPEILHLADAYWSWKQDGRLEAAARVLETRGGPRGVHFWTFWLGEIRREMGDLSGAEEAYLTSLHPLHPFFHYTLTWYRLAGIYEELGEPARARDAWERVLSGWENGDPEVQPRVREARDALAAME